MAYGSIKKKSTCHTISVQSHHRALHGFGRLSVVCAYILHGGDAAVSECLQDQGKLLTLDALAPTSLLERSWLPRNSLPPARTRYVPHECHLVFSSAR
jgi:hypothetical protein